MDTVGKSYQTTKKVSDSLYHIMGLLGARA